MGVRILFDAEDNRACLYDSVTETAFGRVFYAEANGELDANEVAQAFISWYAKHGKQRDPRADSDIANVQDDWIVARQVKAAAR